MLLYYVMLIFYIYLFLYLKISPGMILIFTPREDGECWCGITTQLRHCYEINYRFFVGFMTAVTTIASKEIRLIKVIYTKWVEWPNRLRCFDQIGGFSVQIPPGAQPGLAIQPHYEAAGDLLASTLV